MTWSNLLSGLIGALVGGVFSIIASVVTMRQERSQARHASSRTASTAIVDNILAIKRAMFDIQNTDPGNDSPFETIYASAERILFVYNVMITNKVLRSRIRELMEMVAIWYQSVRQSPQDVSQKDADAIRSYMGYVDQSIKAYLDDRSLPADQPPPSLLAASNA